MENCVTTDAIVKSITHINQILEEVTIAGSTDKRPTSGGIMRSIADIHQVFEDVLRDSKPMQKVFPNMADLVPKIHIQQVTFDNCCKLLLITAAKGRRDVDNMIEDPSHPIWKDTIARRNLDTVMTRFYHLCLETLKHFQESLNLLKGGVQKLRGQVKKKSIGGYRSWLNKSKPPTLGTAEDLLKLVQSVRNYNDIFCTLVWQAVPRRPDYTIGSPFAGNLSCQHAIGTVRALDGHFGCIQRVSQVLYDTWSTVWTCRDHETHSLSMSLKFDYANAGAMARGPDFRFNIAVTSPCFDGPHHLAVDLAHSAFCTCQTIDQDRSSLETYRGENFAGSGARLKSPESSVLGNITAAHRAGGNCARPFLRLRSMQNGVPDLGLEGDLCNALRKSWATIEAKQETENSCFGFLETRSGLRFLLSYVLRRGYQRQGSHSLDDVLVRANSERRTITLEDRLRTALCLAAGVLHLHNSSWLPPVWSSKDIHFFGTDGYDRCALGEPFLQTRLDSKKPRGFVNKNEDSNAAHLSLLSLGLVLIELAFSAPWRKLQLGEEVTKSLCDWEKDLLNLMRLSETVSRELGSRYAKVVQTCLFQGLGTRATHGLVEVELDEVISEDIVKELDRCLSAVTFRSGMQGSPRVTSFTKALQSEPTPSA